MNKKIAVLTGAVLMAFAIFIGGCGTSSNSAEKKDLTLAASSFNYDEVNDKVALDALKAKGYNVKVIVLEDATTMNEATMNGDIDASLHQHKPWMDSYNKSKGRDMVMLSHIFITTYSVCIPINISRRPNCRRMQRSLFPKILAIRHEL